MRRKLQKCRVCGCTDDDCRQCIEKTGHACHWVEKDLCSACFKPPTPEDGERICAECDPPVALILDFSKPGHEFRCPLCGTFEEFLGKRYTGGNEK